MNVRKFLIVSLGAAALVPAAAGATAFDFSTGANNTNLGPSIVSGGVTAEAFVTVTGGGLDFTSTDLWRRNETNDHGIGVSRKAPNSASSRPARPTNSTTWVTSSTSA